MLGLLQYLPVPRRGGGRGQQRADQARPRAQLLDADHVPDRALRPQEVRLRAHRRPPRRAPGVDPDEHGGRRDGARPSPRSWPRSTASSSPRPGRRRRRSSSGRATPPRSSAASCRRSINAERERGIAQAQAAIQAETRQALDRIKREIADLTIVTTERVLKRKLDEAEQRRLIDEALADVDFSSLEGGEPQRA